jgi:hypothetical protein
VQVLELRHGADLLVATPGRLLELLAKRTVSLARLRLLVRACSVRCAVVWLLWQQAVCCDGMHGLPQAAGVHVDCTGQQLWLYWAACLAVEVHAWRACAIVRLV